MLVELEQKDLDAITKIQDKNLRNIEIKALADKHGIDFLDMYNFIMGDNSSN